MRFEWDVEKARTNLRKHGVAFETAVHVFDDPFRLLEWRGFEGGEDRWSMVGLVGAQLTLLVIHTYPGDGDADERVRIVSARFATRHERDRYEQERRRHL